VAYSLENWKDFIADVETERKDWLKAGEESWKEIKKSKRNKRQFSFNPNSSKKSVHYPLWWSSFRIRKPLLYSRTPVPIGKDTTGGDDPNGRTAAILRERLAKGIMKSFDFNAAMEAARDDLLITDLGTTRAYYEAKVVEEPATEAVEILTDELGEFLGYATADGKDVPEEEVKEDEDGFYRELGTTASVTMERVFLDKVAFSDVYFDPDAKDWGKVRRMAWAYDYTQDEYDRIFGRDSRKALSDTTVRKFGKQRQVIRVFECWDDFDQSVVWWPIHGNDFIKPKGLADLDQDPDSNLYGLEKFFPCVPPLIRNSSTDEFYPACEYYQLYDLIQEIHVLASRRYALARAIRVRLMYDNSVPELKELISELGETDGIGVPNLSQTLAAGQGSLANLVQYMPVAELLNGLKNTTEVFEDRLMRFWQLSGVSDLLQGQTDATERTYGEQQLKAKYALNQIAEDQRKMQEFARANIELLCEMALKNFSDESLDRYIVPQTLDATHRGRYQVALALLKDDKKCRFRIEIETDSTIQLNEQYDKAERADLANLFTTALEKTSATAETSPELAQAELKMLLYVLRGYRQGKMFEDDVVQAVQAAADKMAAKAAAPPSPDPVLITAEAAKITAEAESMKAAAQNNAAQANYEIGSQKQQMDFELALRKDQLEVQKFQLEAQIAQQEYQKALADYQIKQLQIGIEREKLLMSMDKASQSEDTKRMRIAMESQVAQAEAQIASMEASVKQAKMQLDARERFAEEARLSMQQRIEAFQKAQELQRPPEQQAPPVVVNNITPQPQMQQPQFMPQFMPQGPILY
jgi:hypothetical protein